MSDLHIPQPAGPARQATYRAVRPGMDTGTRRMLLAAAGLGALFLAGIGVWAVRGRGSAVVPVIEADARPLRVKPENPGGMQVVGAEDTGAGPRSMAPAAEVPAPQALRAQLGPAAAPAPQPAPAAAAPAPRPPSQSDSPEPR